MLSNNNYLVKEYFDLNGHYFKISLINDDIHIVSYNSSLLNGIKYETKITSEEVLKKSQIENFTLKSLYELTIKKIEDNKYTIKSDQNNVCICLLETNNVLIPNKNIQLVVPKNKKHITTEYETILSKEIVKLREDNKKLMNEINDIKNMIELNNCIKKNNNLKNRPPIPQNKILSKSTQNKEKLSKNEIKNSLNNSLNSNHVNNRNENKNNNNQINKPKNEQHSENNGNDLSISKLCNLKFGNYPSAEISTNPFFKIAGYGANSYNGIVREYNEDRVKIILDYKLPNEIKSNEKVINPKICYFAIYDGHGGNKCCNFLLENLHTYLFSSDYFPIYPLQAIYQAYEKAEQNFELIALDKQNKKLLDRSGSCSLSALIIDDWCFIAYLGDSRGLYSSDSGNQLFQVTRDHKPYDTNERKRIEKAGGKVYKDTRMLLNGQKIKVNEKDAPGVKFPYRVSPGNLSVR